MKKEETYFQMDETFKKLFLSDKIILSEIIIGQTSIITPEKLNQNKFEKLYSYGIALGNKQNYKEIIYRHKAGFYIYLSKINHSEIDYHAKILYEQKLQNEVTLFLNFVLK